MGTAFRTPLDISRTVMLLSRAIRWSVTDLLRTSETMFKGR
jgi:hypothetical protein